MRQAEMETRLVMMEKEIRVSGEKLEKLRLDMMCELELLKVDVTAMRRFMKKRHPELVEEFNGLRDEVAAELASCGKEKAA